MKKSLCRERTDRTMRVSKLFILFLFMFLSISLISAVSEGYSCGYYPDSSPFCDAGLSCDNFQCVYSSDPTCSELGGDVCSNVEVCRGSIITGAVENWCCSVSCELDDVGIGGWCSEDKHCLEGLECDFFRCQEIGSDVCSTQSGFADSQSDCCDGLVFKNGRCVDLNYDNNCVFNGYKQCYNNKGEGYCVESYEDCVFYLEDCAFYDVPCFINNVFRDVVHTLKSSFGKLWDTTKWYMLGGFVLVLLFILRPYFVILGGFFKR